MQCWNNISSAFGTINGGDDWFELQKCIFIIIIIMTWYSQVNTIGLIFLITFHLQYITLSHVFWNS